MANGRMLLKRISNSRKLANLTSDGARLLYTWLLSHLDSNGNFYADPVMVNNLVLTRLGKSHKEVERYLDELDQAGLIVRYEVDGEMYLNYPDFLEKQPGLRQDREGVCTIPQCDPELVRSSAGVNPLEAEVKEKLKRKGIGKTDCPMSDIIQIYHEKLPELPSIAELTQTRRAMLRARWLEKPERQDLEWWKGYFSRVKTSDFLMGRAPGNNGRAPFMADFEWLIKPGNLVKVIEGKYDNRNGKSGASVKGSLKTMALECRAKCKGSCSGSWDRYKDDKNHVCHWCSRFDKLRQPESQ